MTTLPILLYIAAVVTVVIIIVNTNSSSKALAYIMLVMAFPVVGIIIYFTLGVNYRKQKLYQKKLIIDKKKLPEIQVKLDDYYQNLVINDPVRFRNYSKLAKNNQKDFFISGNNQTELLINGEEKFPRLLEDLKNAKSHIHLEYYIYEDDDIGNEIGNILIKKAKEGLNVRFMYDDFGSKGLKNAFKKKLLESGVEAIPFYKIKWWLFANGINYRNHRKVVIIDGKIGYIGGINVSDKYINNGKYKLFWRDTHIRIEGLAVNTLQFDFLIDWNFCAQQNIEFSKKYFLLEENQIFKGDQTVQIVSSGPDSDHPNILYAMVQAIMLSKKNIIITTPYFIPDPSLIDALKITKQSGVEIKILIPGISDSAFVNAVSDSYYEELLEVGIRIFKYQKGFVHAKTMVCDDFISIVGTANLDQRSFDLNFEIISIVYDEDTANYHTQILEQDFKDAVEIKLEEWQKRSGLKVLMERTARLVSPLM